MLLFSESVQKQYTDIQQIAIAGKVLRRTFSRAADLSSLHLVGAFVPGSRIVLDQAAVDEKSNEIRALSALTGMLNIKGTVVAADAMHTQRTASELIIDKGGNCVLAVKHNQRSLHKDTKDLLEDPGNSNKIIYHQ